jgi:acetyl-CoA acetyltransferase
MSTRDRWFNESSERRVLVATTLPKNYKIGKDNVQFTRRNLNREPTAYYMNELAAEYAALYDITRQLLGKVTV